MTISSKDIIGKRSEKSHNYLLPQDLISLTSFANYIFSKSCYQLVDSMTGKSSEVAMTCEIPCFAQNDTLIVSLNATWY